VEICGESGNICIIGHNYFDNRFFSNLNKLEINDTIIMEDLEGNFYKYVIYSIFEIDENDISKVQASDENFKTLTLCTCTANKNKRLVIKAKI
jgi:LPXTG-site transpeptidase (sortase) family protein